MAVEYVTLSKADEDFILRRRGRSFHKGGAISYRIGALCDATGKSLLEDGGRLPEACKG